MTVRRFRLVRGLLIDAIGLEQMTEPPLQHTPDDSQVAGDRLYLITESLFFGAIVFRAVI